MEYQALTGYIISAILAGFIFFYKEAIKQSIKSYFKRLSKKQVNQFFVVFMLFTIGIPIIFGSSFGLDTLTDIIDLDETSNDTIVLEKGKTDAEIYTDIAIEGIETVSEITKEIKDYREQNINRLIANKEQVWVYQIGTRSSKEAILKSYKKLKKVDGIEVLKISKRDYILFKIVDENSLEFLNDSLANVKIEIDSIKGYNERIKVIDLALKCPPKKNLKKEKIKLSKKYSNVMCYICD